jgi:hypothetical protein
MKLTPLTLLPLSALLLVTACASSDAPSDNEVYAAAVTEGGGDTQLDGVPGASAAPEDADAAPTADEHALHFECTLPDVRARVEARQGGDGDMRGEGGREGRRGDRQRPDDGTRTSTVGHPGHGHGHGRGHGGPLAFRRLLWIYDGDESGDLDDAERAELEADLAVRCANLQASLLASFDADGDGALSEAELANARAAFEAERVAREVADLATHDADGDGTLSPEERRAAHEARRAALVAAYDADGSGDLNADEAAALRAHLRAVLRGEIAPD